MLIIPRPKDLCTWSDGKALISTGSPFPPVKLPSGDEYTIAECNNVSLNLGPGHGFDDVARSQGTRLSSTPVLGRALYCPKPNT